LDIALEGLVLEQVGAKRAQFVRAGVAQISERNGNYSDLEHILAELKIIEGSRMPERKGHEEILSSATPEPYRRNKEYFTSPVFTLTRGRVGGELQRKSDDSTEDSNCACHHHMFEPSDKDFCQEGDGIVYDVEAQAARGFSSPFPLKSEQLSNLRLNVQDWCDKELGWKKVCLR
jgi:hypothetical protein